MPYSTIYTIESHRTTITTTQKKRAENPIRLNQLAIGRTIRLRQLDFEGKFRVVTNRFQSHPSSKTSIPVYHTVLIPPTTRSIKIKNLINKPFTHSGDRKFMSSSLQCNQPKLRDLEISKQRWTSKEDNLTQMLLILSNVITVVTKVIIFNDE